MYPVHAQIRATPLPQTNPYTPPGLLVEETIEDGEEDSEDPTEETQNVPGDDSNPLNPAGDSLDTLIQQGINTDLWQQMRGDLPCVDATTECIAELQSVAVIQNPLLLEIDTRIEEIDIRIEEAKAANKKSIKLSVLRPAVRVFLEPTSVYSTDPNNPVQNRPRPLEKIAQIVSNPTRIINELLSSVGIPLFDSLFGGSDRNQERAIAISDLEVKLAEIQRGRAELADQVKEKVALAVFDVDTSRREFQLSTEVSRRESARLQLADADYRLGIGTSDSYLGQITSLDRQKAQSFKAWTSLRSQLEKIKLLCHGTP